MTFARHAASNPAGQLQIHCLELSHSAWAAPERRVYQPIDYTVMVDGVPTLFRNAIDAGAWRAAYPAVNDSGRAERSIDLDDIDQVLMAQFEAVRGLDERVQCVLRAYLSDDLTAPVIAEYYEVEEAAIAGGKLTLQVRTDDIGNERDPIILSTLENTPQLRGRK